MECGKHDLPAKKRLEGTSMSTKQWKNRVEQSDQEECISIS